MQKVVEGGRTIHYAKSHHHVLKAWAWHRRLDRSGPAPTLLTLDHHTDLRPAFGSAWSVAKPDEDPTPSVIAAFAKPCIAQLSGLKAKDVEMLVSELRYDEHIDAAQQAGIVGDVFLYQSGSGDDPSKGRHIVKIDGWDKAAMDNALEPAELGRFTAEVAAKTGKPLTDLHYILDVDLDFFSTESSIKPADASLWHALIRNASLITVALEPGCVRSCRQPDERITASSLFTELRRHMSTA